MSKNFLYYEATKNPQDAATSIQILSVSISWYGSPCKPCNERTPFLGATKHLYKSVRPSVRPSVRYAFWFNFL